MTKKNKKAKSASSETAKKYMVRQELVEGHLDPRTFNEELEGRQLWQYHRILSFASSFRIVFIFQLLYFLHICIFSFLVFNHLMEILVPKSLISFIFHDRALSIGIGFEEQFKTLIILSNYLEGLFSVYLNLYLLTYLCILPELILAILIVFLGCYGKGFNI